MLLVEKTVHSYIIRTKKSYDVDPGTGLVLMNRDLPIVVKARADLSVSEHYSIEILFVPKYQISSGQ